MAVESRAAPRYGTTMAETAPTIVVSEFMDAASVARLAEAHPTLYDPALVDDRPRLLAALARARALVVRNRTRVDAAALAAAPGLEAVGRLGVGLDNIDLPACAARGVRVMPATGANALSVAEYVIAAALILTRGCFFARDEMLAGGWPRGRLMGGEVAGRTLGLCGFGDIARLTADKAAALGMRVIAHDPYLAADHPAWAAVGRVTAAELLARADVLSLHVPLTPGTSNLIGAAALAAMKPGAILIDTARGGVIDEAAVAAALPAGHLGGAALDVFAREPLDAAAAAVFAGVPNLILTPHVAGVTREGDARVGAVTADNVLAALAEREGRR